MRRWKTVAAAALAVATWGAMGAGPAHAAAQASIRVGYLSPDASNADVYIDGSRTLSNIAYKTVSSYLPVTPGSHTVDIRTAGSAATDKPLVEVSQGFSANANYTIAVGGRFGQLQAAVFQDQFTTPAAGQALARFVHMAPDVPGVDVVVKGGPVIFSNVSFLQASAYKAVPSGTYTLELHATGTANVLFTATGVAATNGVVATFTGIGGVGKPVELLPIVDANAAASVPVGGPSTGGGGTAARPPSTDWLPVLWALPAALAAVLWLVRGRRRVDPL